MKLFVALCLAVSTYAQTITPPSNGGGGGSGITGITPTPGQILCNGGTSACTSGSPTLALAGAQSTPLNTPATPAVTPTCSGTCATTWTYYIQILGSIGWSGQSASATGSNAATLDSTHYNSIATSCTGEATGSIVAVIRVAPTNPVGNKRVDNGTQVCGNTIKDDNTATITAGAGIGPNGALSNGQLFSGAIVNGTLLKSFVGSPWSSALTPTITSIWTSGDTVPSEPMTFLAADNGLAYHLVLGSSRGTVNPTWAPTNNQQGDFLSSLEWAGYYNGYQNSTSLIGWIDQAPGSSGYLPVALELAVCCDPTTGNGGFFSDFNTNGNFSFGVNYTDNAGMIAPSAGVIEFNNSTPVAVGGSYAQIKASSGIFTGSITSGSGSGVGGALDMAQGTLPGIVANTISMVAPTSVTGYEIVWPSAAASGLLSLSNSSNVVTASIGATNLTPQFAGIGIGVAAPATWAEVEVNSLGTTATDAYELINTTAAAAGAQQVSPCVHWEGQGWKTAASQAVDWCAYVLPVQGLTNPSSQMIFQAAVNGGAYANAFVATSAGSLYSSNTGTYNTSASATAGLGIGGTNLGFTTNGGNDIQMNFAGTLGNYFQQNAFGVGSGSILTWSSNAAGGGSNLYSNLVAGLDLDASGIVGVTNGTQGTTAANYRAIAASAHYVKGTTFTASGCSNGTLVGGATAGTFTLGANSCNVVVTMGNSATAPTGWSCRANDQTAPTILIPQSASNQTTATFAIPGGAGTSDVINFACIGY